jgi:gas vesicle protein
MRSSAQGMMNFLLGMGVGLGLGLLFAPQSGEETREWLAVKAEDRLRLLRRKGRRLIFETQDLLDRGEHGVSRLLRTSKRTGKNALESVVAKLE